MNTLTPRTDAEYIHKLECELTTEREKVQTLEYKNIALEREVKKLKDQIEMDYWPLA
jgi:cell division protein FtsB